MPQNSMCTNQVTSIAVTQESGAFTRYPVIVRLALKGCFVELMNTRSVVHTKHNCESVLRLDDFIRGLGCAQRCVFLL